MKTCTESVTATFQIHFIDNKHVRKLDLQNVCKFFKIDDERIGSKTGPSNIAVPSLTSIIELINSEEEHIAPATQSFFPLINLVIL